MSLHSLENKSQIHETRETNIAASDRKIFFSFLFFMCLVLEVMFPRTWKGRKLKTDPPTLECWSGLVLRSTGVQRMRRHTTTAPHWSELLCHLLRNNGCIMIPIHGPFGQIPSNLDTLWFNGKKKDLSFQYTNLCVACLVIKGVEWPCVTARRTQIA